MTFEQWLQGGNLLHQYRREWSDDFKQVIGVRKNRVPTVPDGFWVEPRQNRMGPVDLLRLWMLRVPGG